MHKSNFLTLIFLLSQILLASSQSICKNDLDCDNDNNSTSNSLRLGNFMCVNNRCKFVVAAGQLCSNVEDCVAYHYSILNNITLNSDICNSVYCTLESNCEGAWQQKDIPSIPNIGQPSSCCTGLPVETKCDIIANGVDPCEHSKSCKDKSDGSKMCTSNEDRGTTTWIGVLICLVGGTTLNIGLNVQKFAFTKHQEELDEQMANSMSDDNISIKNSIKSMERSNLYKKLEKFMFWKQIIVSPIWVLGLGIYIIGSMLTFVSLHFAPQSLIAPLGVVSLVVNLLIAPLLHKQRLTIWDIVGVIIIIIGSVVITLFSGIVQQDYKLCVLIQLFKRPQTITYLTVIGCFILALYTFIRLVERNAIRKDELALVEVFAIASELNEQEKTGSTSKLATNLHNNLSVPNFRLSIRLDENRKSLREDIDQTLRLSSQIGQDDYDIKKEEFISDVPIDDEIKPIPLPRVSISSIRTTRSIPVRERDLKEKVLLPIAYAVLASSMATITTLFAKSLINLLSISFTKHDNQFKDLLSWAILLITVTTAIGQVYWISLGLKKYDALLQVPIFYCNWSLFDIIGGGIYYDEFRNFTPIKYVGFTFGILLIFFGVSLLSKRLAKLTKEEEELKEMKKIWEENKKNDKKIKKRKQ